MTRSARKKMLRIARAKNSALGRAVCRLFGDEAGGVMMEYVILGLLVAAAVVVAVMYFGKNIRMGFNAMGHAVSGESRKSARTVKQSKREAKKGERKSEQHRKKISDT